MQRQAAKSLSAEPRPFIRWAGSKRGLLAHLIPHLPNSYRTYVEPFLGSGALFFLLAPKRARLNDSCQELVDAYNAVRDNAAEIAVYAKKFSMDKETYYRIREDRSADPVQRAAEFLYLNRGCFNGLYRVNSSGKFNVPWGAPKSDFVVSETNLLACQKALAVTTTPVTCDDFETSLKKCRSGDLVFLDPPYVTRHNNNGFVDYNERLFSWQDQIRLAAAADRARAKGCHVIVTNADHKDIVNLYPNFKLHIMTRSSTLASASSKRGRVSEAILVGRQGGG